MHVKLSINIIIIINKILPKHLECYKLEIHKEENFPKLEKVLKLKGKNYLEDNTSLQVRKCYIWHKQSPLLPLTCISLS